MKLKLEKLRKFKTGSFAVWPFGKKMVMKGLHSRVVIIGLNPSAKIDFGENFHKNLKFDHWYEDAFRKSPFRGAYMTDLISKPQSKSILILRKWENDEKFRNKNIQNLMKQFKILGIKNTTQILCIGKKTKELICCEPKLKLKNVWSVNHPNSYRMLDARKKFISDVNRVGRKISKTF